MTLRISVRISLRLSLAGLVIAALSACAPKEEPRDCCARIPPPGESVVVKEAPICAQNLAALYNLTDEEERLIMKPGPICPAGAVSEARIREIASHWTASSCLARTPEDLLRALNDGACPKTSN